MGVYGYNLNPPSSFAEIYFRYFGYELTRTVTECNDFIEDLYLLAVVKYPTCILPIDMQVN